MNERAKEWTDKIDMGLIKQRRSIKIKIKKRKKKERTQHIICNNMRTVLDEQTERPYPHKSP